MKETFSDAVSAARKELAAEIVSIPDQITQGQQSRSHFYSEARVFTAESGRLQRCSSAPASRHVIVRSRVLGTVLGTVRIMLPTEERGLTCFPMQRAWEWRFAPLPLTSTGEISRFTLTRNRTGISPAAGALLRLCLFRGLVEVSAELGLTHWYTIMDGTLLRLLRATGIHFVPVDPIGHYHGTSQPAVCRIDNMLGRMKLEQRCVWEYITCGSAAEAKPRTAHRTLH